MLIADGEEDQRPVRSFEKPVPLSKVKLVVALPDPATGTVRDVIIRDIENGNVFCDRYTGARRWTRYIAGLGTKIPWPMVEPKEQKEYACDTLRMEVETQTFVPTLLRPPMPNSVIDELRNKYSIFRTRHDEEYIAKKMQEDAEKEEKKKLDKAMRTPLNEINKAERKKRKENGKGKLTPEMLERIGAVIANRREALMEAAKTPEVQAALQA
jgi:large subunit ribosomal protein L24